MARLEGCSFGRVTVDGKEHTRDLIVLPDRVVFDRWRRDGHSLGMEDLDEVLDELPGRLVPLIRGHFCGVGHLVRDPVLRASAHDR